MTLRKVKRKSKILFMLELPLPVFTPVLIKIKDFIAYLKIIYLT